MTTTDTPSRPKRTLQADNPRTKSRPDRSNALLDSLRKSYAVFREARPLALGIHKTIQETQPDLNREELRLAMRAHTASSRYLKELATGKERYDLEGNVAGEVTEEQRQIAGTTLRERIKQQNERRKAQEKAVAEAEKARQAEQQKQEKLLQLANRFNRR